MSFAEGKSYEYINEFMFFVIRPDEGMGEGASKYCSGINMTRLLPITKGRHGMGPNPAARGLQMTNLGLRDLAIANGITARAARGHCAGIAPTMDTWFAYPMMIKDMTPSFAKEVLEYCPLTFLKKLSNACRLDFQLPDKTPGPDELQSFIEALCRKFGT